MSNSTWSAASTETRPRRWIARHQLTAYLLLAFALSWSVWPLILLNPTSSPLVPFGPALAALAVTALVGGRRAVLHLLAQLTRWRLRPRWYLAALSPFAITALAGLLAVGVGAPAPALDDLAAWPTGVATVFLSTVLLVGLFEELGWRGYALPHLRRDHGAFAASLVLGAVWLLWHLPLLLSDPTGQRPLLPFVISVLAQSVIMTWLYDRTRGSLPAVMIFHAAVDTAARFVLPEFAGATYLAVWWLLTGLYVLVAGAITWRTRLVTG